MATTTTRVVTVAVLVLALLECSNHGVFAQSLAPEAAGAPSPTGSDCLTALTNMSDCLTYVEAGSNLTKPDKGCCPELAGLVESNPICLCNLLGNSDSIGIKIDLKKAIKLPSVCGVTTPPVSTCSAVGVPVSLPPSVSEGSASPSISPEGATPLDAAGVPSGAPSPSEDKNGASGIEAYALTFTVVLLSTLSVSILF